MQNQNKSAGSIWINLPKDSKVSREKVTDMLNWLNTNKIRLSITMKDKKYTAFVNGFKKTDKHPDLVIREALEVNSKSQQKRDAVQSQTKEECPF